MKLRCTLKLTSNLMELRLQIAILFNSTAIEIHGDLKITNYSR
ncbi:hypothetical protein D1BOALGB6SA_7094 [Olavius sp. associated proteobacterium Delta 1]|nr:hypothetical protein D1BOALGB6SA_7094 [Olavius sp. associated proteobacterium Delta 1]